MGAKVISFLVLVPLVALFIWIVKKFTVSAAISFIRSRLKQSLRKSEDTIRDLELRIEAKEVKETNTEAEPTPEERALWLTIDYVGPSALKTEVLAKEAEEIPKNEYENVDEEDTDENGYDENEYYEDDYDDDTSNELEDDEADGFVKQRTYTIFGKMDNVLKGFYPCILTPSDKMLPASPKMVIQKNRPYLQYKLLWQLKELLPERWKIVTNHQVEEYQLGIAILHRQEKLSFALSVEIDEPYESLDKIRKRKPKDWNGFHTFRDFGLLGHGWSTLRFSEKHINTHAKESAQYVLTVLEAAEADEPVDLDKLTLHCYFRWNKEQAEQWSRERYREDYLDIVAFEKPSIEKLLRRELRQRDVMTIRHLLETAVSNRFLLLVYYCGKPDLVKPNEIDDDIFTGYSYITNEDVAFSIEHIEKCTIREKLYKRHFSGAELDTVDPVAFIKQAQAKGELWRFHYESRQTNELFQREETIRTIKNIMPAKADALTNFRLQLDNTKDEDYLKAFCLLRQDHRTFKFERIQWLEVLDL